MNRSQLEASTSVVSRESVATPEDVAKALELTPGKIEELQREQKLALYRSRARLSENERRIGRGIELEEHYRLTGNADGLAEALALQGKYAEAFAAAESQSLRETLAEKHTAVVREDADCKCDSFTEVDKYNLPNQYVESYGHSLKHGDEMPFIRCTVCGELNARPLLPHLAEQREVRHANLTDKEKKEFFKT